MTKHTSKADSQSIQLGNYCLAKIHGLPTLSLLEPSTVLAKVGGFSALVNPKPLATSFHLRFNKAGGFLNLSEILTSCSEKPNK
jgi:hypothetical protein